MMAFKCLDVKVVHNTVLVTFNFGKLSSQNIFVGGAVNMYDAWLLNNEIARKS
jgi:hypothetical protein